MLELARERDRTIRDLELLGLVLMMFCIPLTDWITRLIQSHSLSVWFAICSAFAVPFSLVFRGLLIVPRIRRALACNESPEI